MNRLMRNYTLTAALVILVAAGVFAAVFRTLGAAARTLVMTNALSVLVQLAALGIAGGILTWILNERSKEKEALAARRQKWIDRQDALNAFRREVAARLIEATNVVRRAPLLIESHQSKKTYGEQLRAIMDQKMEISSLRHEIETSRAFASSPRIAPHLTAMEGYLDGLVAEWRDAYFHLPNPPAPAWGLIGQLPKLADLRQGDEDSIFYKNYLLSYQEALRLIRADIFEMSEDGATVLPGVPLLPAAAGADAARVAGGGAPPRALSA